MIIFKQNLSSIYCDLLCVLSLEKALEAVREKEDLGGGMIPSSPPSYSPACFFDAQNYVLAEGFM